MAIVEGAPVVGIWIAGNDKGKDGSGETEDALKSFSEPKADSGRRPKEENDVGCDKDGASRLALGTGMVGKALENRERPPLFGTCKEGCWSIFNGWRHPDGEWI
jgi:hypothetical protein